MDISLKSIVRTKYSALAGCLLLIFALTPLALLSILGVVLLTSIYIPRKKNSFGTLTSIVLSFLLFTVTNQLFGILFLKINIGYTVLPAVSIQLLLTLLYAIRRNSKTERMYFSTVELFSAAFTMVSIILLGVTALSGAPVSQQLLRHFTNSFDSPTHISITLSDYDTKGYNYGKSAGVRSKIVYKDGGSYPQGWHLNSQLLLRSAFGNSLNMNRQTTKLLFSYFCVLLLWYAITLYLSLVCIAFLFRTFQDTYKRPSLPSLAITGIFIQIFVLYDLFFAGFGNFMAQFAYLFAMIIVLLATLRISEPGTQNNKAAYFLPLASILGSGMVLSWLLSAGVALGVIIVGTILIYKEKVNLFFEDLLSQKSIILYPGIFLFSVVFQSLIFISNTATSDALNLSGGITPIPPVLFIIIVLSPVVMIPRMKNYAASFALYIACMSGASILTGAVFFYQFYSIGTINYFYYKLSYFPFFIGLVFTLALLLHYFKIATANIAWFSRASLLVGSLLFIPVLTSANISSLSFLSGRRKLSNYTASQILSIESRSNYKANIIVLKELDYEEDMITTRYLQMTDRKVTPCEDDIINYIIIKERQKLIDTISTCSKNNKYDVIVSDKNYGNLKAYFEGKNIELTRSN